MLQQGLLEIDYRDHYRLKLTPLSREVLFEGKEVRLVHVSTIMERQKKQKEKRVRTEGVAVSDQDLYDRLREVRRTLAERVGKPPYVIFSNATLADMTAIKPVSMEEFLEVHGVGEHKARKFGKAFMDAIAEHEMIGR